MITASLILNTLLAVIESFLATLAYAILFNVPKRYYVACGVTGISGWILYLAMCRVTTVAIASFAGTLAVVLISRILTVRKKCPITIFLISGIIPLVPGAGIYYTAYYLVTGQMALAAVKGLESVKVAFAIVLGIIFVVSIPRDAFQIRYWRAKRKRKRLKNHGNV